MRIIVPSEYRKDETIKSLDLLLREGGIIAYPTETYYGLGARYDSEAALDKLYKIKLRPHDKAMPLIIGTMDMLSILTPDIPAYAERLIRKFWPGPLTIIFRALDNLSPYITGGTGKVAIRMPGISLGLDLVKRLGYPLTATSANISGMPPATTAAEIFKSMGHVLDAVIDGGVTSGIAPSTIVDVTGTDIFIVRQGLIPSDVIKSAVQ